MNDSGKDDVSAGHRNHHSTSSGFPWAPDAAERACRLDGYNHSNEDYQSSSRDKYSYSYERATRPSRHQDNYTSLHRQSPCAYEYAGVAAASLPNTAAGMAATMTCCEDPYYSIDRGRIDPFDGPPPILVGENGVDDESSLDESDCKPSAKMPFKMKKELSFKIQQQRPIKIEIEIYPGYFLPLSGAHETMEAIGCDSYMPTYCVMCSLTLFCIQDADYVLCPKCRVVSPMDDDDSGGGDCKEQGSGVGLGFTIEELAKWQSEIETDCKAAH